MKIDWKQKLASRKFWVAICSFVSLVLIVFNVSSDKTTQITSIIMAGATVICYMFAEGWIDVNKINDSQK